MMKLPEHIENYLQALITSSREIGPIWLFGSQVNGDAQAGSDWDILIFADESFFHKLHQNGQKPPIDVSMMVVYNGNNFKSPWQREKDGAYEKGSLSDWKWAYQSDNEAKYEGVKELPNGRIRTRWEKAIKIF